MNTLYLGRCQSMSFGSAPRMHKASAACVLKRAIHLHAESSLLDGHKVLLLHPDAWLPW